MTVQLYRTEREMQKREDILARFMAFNRFIDTEIDLSLLYSKKLDHFFIVTEDKIYFDDGVEYLVEELASIKGFSDSMLKFQHAGRKVFGDEIKVLS